ncbi:MAG: TIGR02281 family clan AA aspartic protease [Candidatus Methylomirabilis sp.]
MKRRASVIGPAAALAAGLLFSALFLVKPPDSESSETLTGLVFSSNRVLLEGAVVSLEGIGSVTTDAAGRFTFRDVPPGNYRMTVSKQGFPDDKRQILVQAGRLNKTWIVMAGPAPRPSAPTAVGVPIIQQGGAIFVRGQVNEQAETLFLVDTGATYCVLTKAAADRLGLASSPVLTMVKLTTASGTIEAPLITVDLIQIGGAEARSVEAVIHDMPKFPSAVAGLLGLSFLNQFKVEIDREEGVMLLTK